MGWVGDGSENEEVVAGAACELLDGFGEQYGILPSKDRIRTTNLQE